MNYYLGKYVPLERHSARVERGRHDSNQDHGHGHDSLPLLYYSLRHEFLLLFHLSFPLTPSTSPLSFTIVAFALLARPTEPLKRRASLYQLTRGSRKQQPTTHVAACPFS